MSLTAHLILILLPGVVLDWLLGDPHWMPHPVRWMVRAIAWLEGVLRRAFPKTPAGERLSRIELVQGGTCGNLVEYRYDDNGQLTGVVNRATSRALRAPPWRRWRRTPPMA